MIDGFGGFFRQNPYQKFLSYALFDLFVSSFLYGLYLYLTYLWGAPKLTMMALYCAGVSIVFLANRRFTFRHAKGRVPFAHFMQVDVRRVPFVEQFDAIGALDVLEHIKEDEAVLAQLHSALKPGGVLLLTVP